MPPNLIMVTSQATWNLTYQQHLITPSPWYTFPWRPWCWPSSCLSGCFFTVPFSRGILISSFTPQYWSAQGLNPKSYSLFSVTSLEILFCSMAFNNTYKPTTPKSISLVQIWTIKANMQVQQTQHLPMVLSPNHEHTQSPHHLNVRKSILPVLQVKNLAVMHASSLSLTLQIQPLRKSYFPILDVYPQTDHFSLAALLPGWPEPPLRFPNIITTVFLLLSPHLHLPTPIQI